MKHVAALLLAGGRGTGFGSLSDVRTKAAFPVAGNYRIVDFALSNFSHAGIRQVGIVIQYMPAPLIEHIGSGRPWDFDMADRSLRFMTPFVGVHETRWFHGTADAIAQNLNLLNLEHVDNVLILSADHVYLMDYRKIISHHQMTGADVTMAYTSIPPERQHPRFGNLVIDENGRVSNFVEKPPRPVSSCVSMGIFCFKLDVLRHLLSISRPARSEEDFSLAGHVIQQHVGQIHAQPWRFDGPWFYLADLYEYHRFHMQLARGEVDLFGEDWNVMTNFSDRNLGWRPPSFCARGSRVSDSIVSPGCRVEGEVVSSVLSPGVSVAPGAVVRNCVIMHDVVIERGVHVENSIIDKDARLEEGCEVGIFSEDGADAAQLTVVPRGYRVRPGQRLAPGADFESLFMR